MNRGRQLVGGVALVIVLVCAWQWLRPLQLPEAQRILPDELPRQNDGRDSSALDRILAKNLFDPAREALAQDEAASSGSADSDNDIVGSAPESWKLLGISKAGDESVAVIDVGGRVERLSPGDLLPDGAELKRIDVYGIEYTKEGVDGRASLFGKD